MLHTQTWTRHPLHETLAQLQAANREFAANLLTAPDSKADWVQVCALTAKGTPYLQALFRRVAAHYPTQDKRAPVALWFGRYAYAVEAVAIACYLAAGRVPDMSPNYIRRASCAPIASLPRMPPIHANADAQ